MSNSSINPEYVTQRVVLASGATTAAAFSIAGYTRGSIALDANIQGDLVYLAAEGKTGRDSHTTVVSNAGAAIKVGVAAVHATLPFVMPIRDEAMNGSSLICKFTSAVTGEHTIVGMFKGV